ncbi:MAG: ferritin-like domain-containing protein [Caldisericia bacterium]
MNYENVLDILKGALLLEIRGKSFYQKSKEEAKIEEVKNIFKLMEEEEEKHIEIIKKQFENYTQKGIFILPEEIPSKFNVSDYVISEKLKNEIKITDYESLAIYLAINFEKEAFNFYSEKAKHADNEDERKLLNWLSEWEKSHVEFLSKIDEELKEKIWFDNKFWPLY